MTTIVLLPGMDGTGRMFAELVSVLETQCRVAVISYPDEQALGYRELENHVRFRLPTGEPFILLAESFSGPIAISIAASKPSGLVGLILCCTFARNPVPLLRPLKELIVRMPLTSRFTGLLSPLLFGRSSTKMRRIALRQALDGVSGKALQMRLRSVLDVDYSDQVPEIDVPMLYLQATNDRIVSSEASHHIQSLAPRMNVARVVGPHLLLQSKPKEAGDLILKFAKGITAYTNNAPLP
jgi:pimeloyl-[acyl-carrier protein] methyl ester esterase